jgi:hypothetical protein
MGSVLSACGLIETLQDLNQSCKIVALKGLNDVRQKETVASVQIRRYDSVAIHDVFIAITEVEQAHDFYILHVAITLPQYLKYFTWFP